MRRNHVIAVGAFACAGSLCGFHDASAAKRTENAGRPRVIYNRGASRVPNLAVVARAISIEIGMRAAGVQRTAHVATDLGAGSQDAPLFTDSPLEARTATTRLDPGADVVPALRHAWPEVGERGARILAAQYAVETGSGRHCYNFNLGNHKASATEPHMYLRGVWEGLSPRAFSELQNNPSLGPFVHEESEHDRHARGHVVPPGNLVVILDPPHPAARFRANASLDEGAARFVELHRRTAVRAPELSIAIARGDSRAVAEVLASPKVRYYTGSVDAYAQGLANQLDIIDEGLGPSLTD